MSRHQFLSKYKEGEYGSGDELSATSYLIWGLLTFWIYNVWQFHKMFSNHLMGRLYYFMEHQEISSYKTQSRNGINTIIHDGFSASTAPRNIAIFLYSLSLSLLISEECLQILVYNQLISLSRLDLIIKVFVALSAFIFCGATIIFITSMIKSFRNHEYNELLLYRFVDDPKNFEIFQPSILFKKRWGKKYNYVALFLVLSVPITLSPLIALKHIYVFMDSGLNFEMYLIAWFILLFIFAGVFHFWGTQLLITMYNDHLRIETLNRSQVTAETKWVSRDSNSIAGNRSNAIQDDSLNELTPRRTLAAIMLTDMVGFSKDMEKHEGATYEKLLRHNEIIRKEIASNNGKEIKTIGDAFLVKYSSAVDAVRSAINIQNQLSDYNENAEEHKRINIRIGIHIGDVLIMGTDVIGNGVNIAARIEPLADVGGICISADVYNIIKKSIDIKVANIGKRDLKNIQDAPEIYQILLQSIND
ncbi:MAG: adenylate/guanylate cyclase domain-containing protein [Desulfobacteraceae bacterium]|nr:adenylate/guanylate cyclase domain-containing protein [Desulfobacteraceae bacterium]